MAITREGPGTIDTADLASDLRVSNYVASLLLHICGAQTRDPLVVLAAGLCVTNFCACKWGICCFCMPVL